jgi:hypothetical protein
MAGATNRRAFLWGGLALPGAVLAGCRREIPAREQLAERLDLEPAQRRWLNELTPEQQQRLLAALSPGASREVLARGERLIMKVIGPRDRLFAFVGYPPTARRRTVCDGLLRE